MGSLPAKIFMDRKFKNLFYQTAHWQRICRLVS